MSVLTALRDGGPKRAVLASYPKSGSNWVRYCIEYFSGKGTPGSQRRLLHPDAEMAIDRTHFLDKADRQLFSRYVDSVAPTKEKVGARRLAGSFKKRLRRLYLQRSRRIVLLLRDPCELYVRVEARDPLALRGYFSNILVFDEARQPKILKYYDELVSDFEHVRDILDFLGIDNRSRAFDVEEHRRLSLALYKQGRDAPASEGELMNFRFHSKDLDQETRTAIEALGREVLGVERYRRYLGRYAPGGA